MKIPNLQTLKDRGTLKWRAYDEEILPLWVAESDFETAAPVKAAISDAVNREAFGYPPKRTDLPEAFASFAQQRYDWAVDPACVVPAADVVRAMLLGIQYFTKPGSAVVVPVPAYPPFLELPVTAGREMIEIGAEGGIDLAEVEGAFKSGAGSILLASPHNPLGYTFDEDFLRGLANIAGKYDARILSDEIHAPLVYDGRHVPTASVSDTAARVTLTATATSKAWNVAGLKCAQLIFSNSEDLKTWKSLTGVAKDGVGTLGIVAAEACYREGLSFLDDEVDYLRSNRDFLVEALPAAIPGLRVSNPAATYLMWLDFSESAIADEKEPAAWLRRHAKVALNEGTTFNAPHHARLNFATSREILEEAVQRIGAAFA